MRRATIVGSLGLVLVAGCGGAPGPVVGAANAPSGCERSSDDPGPQHLDRTRTGSSVLLAKFGDKTVAYVADEDQRVLHTIDVDSKKVLHSTALDGTPGQIVLTADGRLVVALRDRSKLRVYEPGDDADDALSARCEVPTPAEPVGLALSPKGERLLVTSGWGRSLSVFDAKNMQRRSVVELEREPRGVVASADGKRAYVSHMVGGWLSQVDIERGELAQRVSLDSPPPRQRGTTTEQQGLSDNVDGALVRERRQLDDGSLASSQAFAVARSDALPGRIWVPQVLVNPGGKNTRTIGYGNGVQTQIASIAVVDAKRSSIVETSLDQNQLALFAGGFGFGGSFGGGFGGGFNVAQQDQQPCLLPRAVAVDAKTSSLLVACMGIDALVAFDAASVRPALTEKRRWSVPAGPNGVAVDGAKSRAVVWSQFDRALSVVSLSGPELVNEQPELDDKVAVIEIPGPKVDPALAMGRRIFHASGDSRISADGRACASCHPDGRDDALTWSTPNGPRRTLTLTDRLPETAPYAWDGTSKNLDHHLANTFQRLRGTGVTRVEKAALVSYLRSLASPVAPTPRAPSEVIAYGEKVFHSRETGCASCHDGQRLTDNRQHDVKSRAEADAAPKFNTPSLRHVAHRAPYFHDGRYATLREVLLGTDGAMGHSKHLKPQELSALLAYLETL